MRGRPPNRVSVSSAVVASRPSMRAATLQQWSCPTPSTNPSRWPQSPNLRLREKNDSISLDIKAEHWMAIVTLRIHQHRLTQPPPYLPKEATEHIKSLLTLQLPQVDVEVDLIVSMEAKDRQHIGNRPDSQVRALGIRRAGQHGLRSGHRKHHLAFGVLARPPSLRDKIEDCLPVLHRRIWDTHVRQRPHQVRVEEAAHVIPQQISHTAMLPVPRVQRSPVSLDQRHRGTTAGSTTSRPRAPSGGTSSSGRKNLLRDAQ